MARLVSRTNLIRTENQVLVTARLRKLEDGDWRLSVDSKIGNSRSQMHGARLKIPPEAIRWMFDVSSVESRVLGGRGATTIDPAGPIILLRRRAMLEQIDLSAQPSPNPMPGFMLWLERM